MMLNYLLTDYWNQYGDPRIIHLPLMSSAKPLATLLLVYLIFVLWLGPYWLMANRAPFSLRPLMIIYNLFMSCMNLYFFFAILYHHNFGLDMFTQLTFPSFTTTKGEGSEEEIDSSLKTIFYLHHRYMLSKFVDLVDTIFFVLRKKQSQITWLHVYHHFSVPIQAWTYFRLCGNSSIVLPFGVINSFVHTIMYAYYCLAAWLQASSRIVTSKLSYSHRLYDNRDSALSKTHYHAYLWWKRYLTQLQICQFVAIFLYNLYFLCYQNGYPLFFVYNSLVQTALYTFLFTRFYLRTYSIRTKKNRNDDNKRIQ